MFDRVLVINLDRRPEKWQAFCDALPSDWPLAEPTRFAAVDGSTAARPDWWDKDDAGWGLMQTHIAILQSIVARGDSVLILEDDAVFCPDFAERFAEIADECPDDWEQLYLGGNLITRQIRQLRRISEHLIDPGYGGEVNACHAVGMRGQFAVDALENLTTRMIAVQVDYRYGRLHRRDKYKIYCACPWLVGQRAGFSDRLGKELPEQWFQVEPYIRIRENGK